MWPLWSRATSEQGQFKRYETLCSVTGEWQEEVLDNIACLPGRTCSSEHLPHRGAKSAPGSSPGKALQTVGGPSPCQAHLLILTCADLIAHGCEADSSHSCLQPTEYSENDLTLDSIFWIVKTFKMPSYLCLPGTVGVCRPTAPQISVSAGVPRSLQAQWHAARVSATRWWEERGAVCLLFGEGNFTWHSSSPWLCILFPVIIFHGDEESLLQFCNLVYLDYFFLLCFDFGL